MGLFKKIFGDYSQRQLKRIIPIVDKIDALESTIQHLSDEELKNKTFEFKKRIQEQGETLDDILIEAFAIVREASHRVLHMKHYREQLIGGVVLHQGRIAEMKTGEGKTLVATLPTYLNALSGKGAHVVTVNDYLAERDCQEMSVLYNFLGLTTGVVTHSITGDARKDAYAADITYGTNNEFGFDYLRDNMVIYKEDKVQRDLSYCIVDEVDSILIDEARTPLIISGSGDKSTEFYFIADCFVKTLLETDYKIDEKTKSIMLSEEGVAKAETSFKIENFSDLDNLHIQHYILQALKANYIMKSDTDYIVRNNEILIVDEFTGRVMDGRRYSDGLHQAIEAKEGVEVQRESKTLATITYQNYFRLYNKLSGMTGTAITEEAEFREIYGLDVVAIPTHRDVIRIDHVDSIYKTARGKYNAIVKEIISTQTKGQPVLVGTTSIEKSEYISSLLKKEGIIHTVLNAKYHEHEAEIVSSAGEFGKVTIATNMAGRGTDIKLSEDAKSAGGLKIIGTERHESRRIDNQLRGRSGRQGDPGESRFYLSMEDDLLRLFGSDKLLAITDKLGLQEDEAIENKMVSKSLESAQKKVEGNNFDIRKRVLSYDDVMNKQRTLIYTQRNEVLNGLDIKDHILTIISSLIENIVSIYNLDEAEDDYEETIQNLFIHLENIFGITILVDNETLLKMDKRELIETLTEMALNRYSVKEAEITTEILREIERVILLRIVDEKWMDHIDSMEHLKQGIGLRAYKQEDPITAYQEEGSDMFAEMIDTIQSDTIRTLFHISPPKDTPK